MSSRPLVLRFRPRSRRVPVLAATLLAATTWAVSAGSPSPVPSDATEPELLVTCGGDPFPASMLGAPAGAQLGIDPAARRLAVAISAAEFEGSGLSRLGWIRAVDRPDLVLFIAWARDGDLEAPLWAITVAPGEAEGPAVDGWDVWSVGRCRPRVELPSGLGAATWEPDGPVAADQATFVALVTERECASGEPATGRVAEPAVLLTPEFVTITFGVRPPSGDQSCPSNPPTPVSVTLPEPLGRRALVDGGVLPPRVVQGPPPDPRPTP